MIQRDLLEKGNKNAIAVTDEFIEKIGVEEEEQLKILHIDKKKEIDELKCEIKRLKRKDGKNYSYIEEPCCQHLLLN